MGVSQVLSLTVAAWMVAKVRVGIKQHMSEWMIIGLAVIGYIVLMRFVLPRFGVPT